MRRPAPTDLGLLAKRQDFAGPTFTLGNRVRRLAWSATWLLAARWTPPGAHRWRVALLRAFGAQVAWTAHVYPSVRIWAPWNLHIDDEGTLAPRVECYDIAPVRIGRRAIVSQGAFLCTGNHDYRLAEFPLTARPIVLGAHAWICAGAVVGPGVSVGEGAVLGLGSVATADLAHWTVYAGNPAVALKARPCSGAAAAVEG